ncbi:MAG: GxxExxY protein [Chitinophagales bacterium]|nr:GxxExxY protein [Chitinophagales bacterium]
METFTQQEINQLSYDIVGCAIEVHKQLGPGLLESIYEECLVEELKSRNFQINTQVRLPLTYKTKTLRHTFKLDILVNNLVVIEVKAIESVLPVHKAQLLTYLKLARKPKGLLINFHTENITKSAIPLVTDLFAQAPEH